MKKFFITILIALTLSNSFVSKGYAGLGTDEEGNKIGPFKATEAFCQSFSTMGALLNAFQIVQWPVAGFPGIVMGLTQRTSVIHDVCDFLNQLSQLDGVNAIFFSANYLNELTGKKWDHHLKMADQTWNLANSIYDFDNGSMRPGALTSQSTARELNDWMESAYTWQGKTFNNKEVYVKHRQERESEMQAFSRASYQRAILQDAVNCPDPKDKTDYSKIYQTQVKKHEISRDDAKEDVDFFRQQLSYMGPKFMNNDEEMKQYSEGLERLVSHGISYKTTEAKKTVETSKPTKNKNKDGHVVQKKEKIAKVYYKYSVTTDAKLWKDFKSKWAEKWGTWVSAQWTSNGSFGALTGDAEARVEAEFKDLSYECNPGRLGRGLDRDSPKYDADLTKLVEECKNSTVANQKKSANLFEYYVTQLQAALYNLKNSNANIWSVESEYAGIHRLVSVKSEQDSKGGSFQQEAVSCSEKLQPAEMQLVSVKQQNVNNALTEQIAKESMKQTSMMEAEKIEKEEQAAEYNKKRVLVEEREREYSEKFNNISQPFPYESGKI